MKNSLGFKKIISTITILFFGITAFCATETKVEPSIFDNDLNFALLVLAIVQIFLFVILGHFIKKIVKTKPLWKSKKLVVIAIVFLTSLTSNPIFAATNTSSASMTDSNTWILLLVNIFLFVLLYSINNLLGELLEIATGKKRKKTSITKVFAQPEIAESDLMTDHEYDGIRELDNNLPTWWIGLFYGGILFALVYIPYYHFSDAGQLQEEEYASEMKQAEEDIAAYQALKGSMVDETNAEILTDVAALASGKEIFISKCAPCHGQSGEGVVGPNLTDKYWLYGGDVKDVFKSIKHGIPAKGMIAWKSQLSPTQILETASYILSLQGTSPANAKAPQGDLFEAKKAEILENTTDSIAKN